LNNKAKEDLIQEAKELHDALLTYNVSPQKLTAEVVRLHNLYKEIIAADQSDLHETVVLEDAYDFGEDKELNRMIVILNKLVHHALCLEGHEMAALEAMDSPEAARVREYFQFQDQLFYFNKFIWSYLVGFKDVISKFIIHVADNQKDIVVYPQTFRKDDWLMKIHEMRGHLKTIERERMPLRVYAIYQKIADILYGIDVSKMPPEAAQFFSHQLNRLKGISFAGTAVPLQKEHEQNLAKNKLGVH
jgi:hypothetical protein